MRGFISFQKKSARKFHGLGLYVANHLSDSVLRVPDEDEELEIVHILLKSTTPNLNIIGCYLDVESRQDNSTIEGIWTKLVCKAELAIARGEGVIIMGDLNRPLQAPRPSFGTKLVTEWENKGIVKILNDNKIPTRIDPVTGKGSVLDLGIVSKSIVSLVSNFTVDSDRNWSPFSLRKVAGGTHKKNFSDHLAIKIEIGIEKRKVTKAKKREITKKGEKRMRITRTR